VVAVLPVEVEELVVVEGFLTMEPEAVAVLAVEAAVVVSVDVLVPEEPAEFESEEDPHPMTENAQAAVTARTRRPRSIRGKLIFNG